MRNADVAYNVIFRMSFGIRNRGLTGIRSVRRRYFSDGVATFLNGSAKLFNRVKLEFVLLVLELMLELVISLLLLLVVIGVVFEF